MNLKRRSILTYFGVGWLVSFLPAALAACSPNSKKTTSVESSPTPADNGSRSDGFSPIGKVGQLDDKGTLQKTIANDKVVVIRNPANPQQLVAVNPTCTHKGCTVVWLPDEKQFDCPCHNSDFTADGKVIKGPARKPLKTYQAKIEGDTVLAKL